ncbi:MAG TPA: hypothetical protein VN380_13560 [Thermoanaerobaculia bacterium]|nr:hypothetical protein [Thermoanaerobaculia bacterium]
MASDILHLLFGAGLATAGGAVMELWREGRGNHKEVVLLQREIAATSQLCDVLLASREDLSVTVYLQQWKSFATQGAAASRAWLRVIPDRDARDHVLRVYLMTSSLVSTFEEFAAREGTFKAAKDRDGFYHWIAEHRKLAIEAATILKNDAESATRLLQGYVDRPLLL